MFDVVCDFIMSRWPGSHESSWGGFVEIRVSGNYFVFFFEDAGIRSGRSRVVFNYDDPLFFEKLVGYLKDV